MRLLCLCLLALTGCIGSSEPTRPYPGGPPPFKYSDPGTVKPGEHQPTVRMTDEEALLESKRWKPVKE